MRLNTFTARILIAGLGGLGLGVMKLQAEPESGPAIFKRLCVECHGEQGEGVAGKCDEALHGERSLESLAKYIDRTMPEDKPELLNLEGSKAVASYIFEAFYSPAARVRQHPSKVEPVRLTVRQFRESVADLVGSFSKARPMGQGTGLEGKYFQSDGMNKKAKRGLERIDQALVFDFGEGSPAEGIKAEQYSIAWQGSLLAPDTGWYDFKLTTPNGARLYLNGEFRDGDGNFRDDSDAKRQPALIDEWVSSGDTVRESTARVFLLGGRAYPIRLDYFKFKDKRGSVKLEWQMPHAPWAVVAVPYLSPSPASHVTVMSTSFPADDSSVGYERGTSVSKEWHQAVSKAAVDVSVQVVNRLRAVSGVKEDDPERVPKLKDFVATFASRAFRRPISTELRQLYVEKAFAEGVAPEVAVQRAVMLVLQSPRFLHPNAGGQKDSFATAARLALALWDSLPDQALIEAAAAGQLATDDQVAAQAKRMLNDTRAKARLHEFFAHWLKMDEGADLSKDQAAYPGFDSTLISDLRKSLELFVDRVLWSESSDYRSLLNSDIIFLNERLAKFYGRSAAGLDAYHFQPVAFNPKERTGVLTHPFMLSTLSYHKSSSPIHRGVFLTRNVLGRFLKPPPMAIEFMDDRFDPSLTMREKVTQLTSKASCMGCHVTINPLGFSLENFDAVGRWRTTDNSKPINAESDYTTSDGEKIVLRGPRDVAYHASTTDSARRGFIRHLFHSLAKGPLDSFGANTLDDLDASFVSSGHHMRQLVVTMATRIAQQGSTTHQANR